jgi:hypothetical protein
MAARHSRRRDRRKILKNIYTYATMNHHVDAAQVIAALLGPAALGWLRRLLGLLVLGLIKIADRLSHAVDSSAEWLTRRPISLTPAWRTASQPHASDLGMGVNAGIDDIVRPGGS